MCAQRSGRERPPPAPPAGHARVDAFPNERSRGSAPTPPGNGRDGVSGGVRRLDPAQVASMTSWLEACLDLRASARPLAPILHNSVPVVLVPARHRMACYAA